MYNQSLSEGHLPFIPQVYPPFAPQYTPQVTPYYTPQFIPQVYPPVQPNTFPPVQKHRHWDSNICDCCIDCSTCCRAFTCPCCVFQDIANHVNHTNNYCYPACCCFVFPCSWFLRSPYRKKLRVKYNLPAKPCNDLCTVFWCPCCSLAQEWHEIKNNPAAQVMA
jgi:Cys-rich protein (TIGR01571 family)